MRCQKNASSPALAASPPTRCYSGAAMLPGGSSLIKATGIAIVGRSTLLVLSVPLEQGVNARAIDRQQRGHSLQARRLKVGVEFDCDHDPVWHTDREVESNAIAEAIVIHPFRGLSKVALLGGNRAIHGPVPRGLLTRAVSAANRRHLYSLLDVATIRYQATIGTSDRAGCSRLAGDLR